MFNKKMKTVLWGVDAVTETELARNTAGAVRAFLKGSHATVEPVFVMTADQLGLSEAFTPDWKQTYMGPAQDALRNLTKTADLPQLLEPRILVDDSIGLRATIQRFTRYAKSHGADLIVVSTHARRGIERFLLGSFAETLILHSKTPVLVVNPASHRKGDMKNILFPTDFSKTSRKAYAEVLELAKRLGATVTVYYRLVMPLAPTFRPDLYLASRVEDDKEARNRDLKEWVKIGEEAGVEIKKHLDDATGNVAGSILAYAQSHHMDLIAMASQAGPVEAVLLGSVARQIVRTATCPVLLC